MERESGSKSFPIWLIGDSNPRNWEDVLADPLDSRHPARHNIWTPILDGIQERVYRTDRLRVDTSLLYVRNAIENSDIKNSAKRIGWDQKLLGETERLKDLLDTYKPKLVFTFGAFAFEFTRRSLGKREKRGYSYWNTERLGKEFRHQADNFRIKAINVLPLLHVSVARGRFLEANNYFTGQEGANYFEHTADAIARILTQHRRNFPIWKE